MSQFNALIEQGIAKGKRPDISTACVYDTVWSHDQLGLNYQWLWPTRGLVLWIDFREPAGTGKWRTYDRYWWARHAALVSHEPDKLVEEHVKWYVHPATKKIDLRFWFERPTGEVYSMAPTREFYELERDFFANNHLCTGHVMAQHTENSPGPTYLYPAAPKTRNKKRARGQAPDPQ